jgi:hypothetical protein
MSIPHGSDQTEPRTSGTGSGKIAKPAPPAAQTNAKDQGAADDNDADDRRFDGNRNEKSLNISCHAREGGHPVTAVSARKLSGVIAGSCSVKPDDDKEEASIGG